MNIPYTLMPFQIEGVEYIKSRKYSLLGDDMGLGKTIQALAACVELKTKKILIICPRMLIDQWLEKAKEFYTSTYIATLKNERSACEYLDSWIQITTYGYAASNQYLKNMTFDMVIIDESHFLKNPTAKRTKRILGKGSFLKGAAKVLLMTGTPVMNRPAEIYILLKTFCPEKLGKYLPWPMFVRRYCGFAAKGATHTDELGEILKRFMLRRTKEQVLDQLPPIIEQKISVDCGAVPEDEYLPTIRRLVSEAKIPHIIEYCEEILQSIDKILLICYHRETIKQIETSLKNHNAVVIVGGQSDETRQKNLTQFKTNPECKVLIGQINTIGFGVDGLQHVCDRIIFGELDWSPGVLNQAIDRLRRIGQTKPVFVDYLIAKGTIEERIDSKLRWKRKVIHELTETDIMPPKKQTGLEDALHVFAQLVADKVLAGMPGGALAAPLVEKAVQTVTKVVEAVVEADPEGMELVGGPIQTPKSTSDTDAKSAEPLITPSQATTSVAPSDEPEVTLDQVSDAIYGLLNKLEDGGVSKQTALDYYKNQIINGFSAPSIKGLKPSEYPKVMEKLSHIDVTKLITNLKPAASDDGI